MAEPAVIECTTGVWTPVAIAVTSGVIFRKKTLTTGAYKQTYRLTGAAAPTDDSDSGPIFTGGDSAEIGHNAAIDVYIKSTKETGEVRVDL